MPTVSDNFTRANNTSLGGNWTGWSWASANSAQIVSNEAAPNAVNSGAYWSANTFANDQTAQITIGALPTFSDWVGVLVRQSGTGGGGYLFIYWNNNGSPQFQLYKNPSGATALGSSVSGSASVGDTLKLNVAGTSLTCYHNGSSIITATDGTIASGSPGIGFFNQHGAAAISLFNGTDGKGSNLLMASFP